MRADALISYVQTLIGDPEGDYHDREKVLLHLNTALQDIATRSRTICDWVYIAVSNGRGMYGMPDGFLEFKYVGYYHQGQLLPLSPGSIDDTAPAVFRDRVSAGQIPHTYTDGGNAFVEKLIATVIAHPTNPNADNTGESIFWSSAPAFGVKIGDRLINMTDNSEGKILELSSGFSQINFLDLRNGEDNRMEIDDEFRILSQTAHRHTLVVSPPPAKNDTIGAESLYAYIARDHKHFTIDDLDNENDEIELGEEFNSVIRYRVLYYMSMDANGIEHQSTIAFDVSYNTDYHSAFLKANSRIKQYLNAWMKNRRRLPPRRIITQTADWSVGIPYGRK